MRDLADADHIDRFLRALGEVLRDDTRTYLVGGATMVLQGIRGSTIDIDVRLVPDSDEALRAIARLKDELQVNVELASPQDFIPGRARSYFARIEPELFRFPAVDPAAFRRAVTQAFG